MMTAISKSIFYRSRTAPLLFCSILSLGALTACGSRNDSASLTELRQGNLNSTKVFLPKLLPASSVEIEPVKKLYDQGLNELQTGLFSSAATTFETLIQNYPYAASIEQAQLLLALSHIQDKNPETAATQLRYFTANYPYSAFQDYALYLDGLNSYSLIGSIKRDISPALKASQAFNTLTQNYPNSEYHSLSKGYLLEALTALAAKEMEVGRYYLNENLLNSARNRFHYVLENFPSNEFTPEALYRLVEIDLSLGIYSSAQDSYSLLNEEYPESSWTSRAKKLLPNE